MAVGYKILVMKGYTYAMHPGDTATIEVKVTNLSASTDWAVEVAITQNPVNIPGYTPYTMGSYWENGVKFKSGERLVVPAGSVRTLSIKVFALDGAGTEDIQISVHRFKPGELA